MQEDPRKIIKQTEEWTLYEEGLESWAVNVEFPMEALKGANGSLKLTIPADCGLYYVRATIVKLRTTE